jgi:ferredoxin-NADP reductase
MMDWKIGTLVESRITASDIKSLFFEIENWPGHLAGQHCDIRLTAPTGYQAQRSYSIASTPDEKYVEFGVQLLTEGEVSPYLWEMKPGDQVEIKGPLGGHFIWTPDMPGELVLIGGGSGIAPLLSIYKTAKNREVVFIESAATTDKIMYYEELKDKLITRITSIDGHIDQEFLQKHLDPKNMPMIYICGPTPFVETVASALVVMGFNSHSIRTERFG